jgi:cytochrome c-type biogenesis protein CcmH
MLRYATIAALWLLLVAPALAFEVDKPLADATQEARAQEVSKLLRCLVCQNQSIAESNAALAKDLRVIVRERIGAGDSDTEVVDYVVARYGDWVLLDPPFKITTYVLWVGPVLLLLLAVAGILFQMRRGRARAPAAAPLSSEEQRRLEALLDEDSAP